MYTYLYERDGTNDTLRLPAIIIQCKNYDK